jgi:MoxR-like ATPase
MIRRIPYHGGMHAEIARIQSMLEGQGYVADQALATSVYLAIQLRKPLLIEGAAGVGKTEVAKVMARALDTDLIRLQCYEGLDATTSLYEWNYQRQLLHIRMLEQSDKPLEAKEKEIFSETFLLKRPLLAAITHEKAPVLLVDECDQADEEWEAFLLEVLSDWQVTIPEIGTIRALHIPYVVLTSNRTRELGDALRRRCLYLWIDYPSLEKELAIVRRKVPGINGDLAEQIATFMQLIRRTKLEKTPGIAETLDWSAALIALHRDHLDADAVEQTIGVLFKHREDADRVRSQWLDHLLRGVAETTSEARPLTQAGVDRVADRVLPRR